MIEYIQSYTIMILFVWDTEVVAITVCSAWWFCICSYRCVNKIFSLKMGFERNRKKNNLKIERDTYYSPDNIEKSNGTHAQRSMHNCIYTIHAFRLLFRTALKILYIRAWVWTDLSYWSWNEQSQIMSLQQTKLNIAIRILHTYVNRTYKSSIQTHL